jgi:site-specific DNA recombinase
MIAAIYARKSTEQTGVADEQKSVARQVDHARAYAVAKGWTVADDHVYVDDGISGAEFATRPGFLRLMNALKPRAPFDALVMSEESRLGREAIETAYALKQIVQSGVRVFFYLENRERTLDSPTDKIMLSLTAFADELEREKARQRTYDAMLRKARAGHVTGGRVFGYDNVEVTGSDGRRSHVERRINEAEAAVVRQIFELAAKGHGLTTIVKTLNAERAPSPRAQQGRPAAWAQSSIREVLYRELYRGVIVWNKSRKRNRWGVKHQQPKSQSEWIRISAPDLRIVSDPLWNAAHAQMDQQRRRYAPRTRGAAPWGNQGKYLLTGLLRCAVCGGGLEVRSRSHGTHRAFFYGCSSYHRRGTSVCTNCLTMPMETADDAVLTVLENGLLDQRVLDAAVRRTADRLSRRGNATASVRRELARVDSELANLSAAIAAGGDLPALVDALRARDTERRLLAARLAEYTTAARFVPGAVMADLQERLTDWRSLLRDETPKARVLVKQLLVGRIDMEPGEGLYRFRGKGTLEPLLSGIVPLVPQCGSSPTGFEPVFWP